MLRSFNTQTHADQDLVHGPHTEMQAHVSYSCSPNLTRMFMISIGCLHFERKWADLTVSV